MRLHPRILACVLPCPFASLETPAMSNPTPDTPPPAPSQTGRYLFVLILGLLLGVACVVMALRALESGKTWQDRYPSALMQLMSAHSAQLGQKAEANRCTASELMPHLEAMRMLGNDLEPAFAELGTDRRFMAYASDFRAQLDQLLTEPPHTCDALAEARGGIGAACKACHQDFR